MTDSEILQEILKRLTSLETGQAKLEAGQAKLERKVDGQRNWFEVLAQKFDNLHEATIELKSDVTEIRELMVHLHDDDVVQKHAISNLASEIEALKGSRSGVAP